MNVEKFKKALELNKEMEYVNTNIQALSGAIDGIYGSKRSPIWVGGVYVEIPSAQAKQILDGALDAYISELSRIEYEFNEL